ncbi:hypothetical protein HYPSUDRAFT_411216 [Hypholoma sublateritium FD-334 SS-4]|uniref:Uncharacterized protein n=1 Tax=Hypholoma sublateritium (strain FD-334 SS-4) TaxID=945553 RepID=A0A0D2LVY0_HYPSF|nr:hypothetical protein HYPSUDRAFT_411216 [Hypholoma sublateritium FD-334 SS-4]
MMCIATHFRNADARQLFSRHIACIRMAPRLQLPTHQRRRRPKPAHCMSRPFAHRTKWGQPRFRTYHAPASFARVHRDLCCPVQQLPARSLEILSISYCVVYKYSCQIFREFHGQEKTRMFKSHDVEAPSVPPQLELDLK